MSSRECHLRLKKGEKYADFCLFMLDLQNKVIDLENTLKKDAETHEKLAAIFERQISAKRLAKDHDLRADYEKRYEALITVRKQGIQSHLERLDNIQRDLLRAVQKIKVKID